VSATGSLLIAVTVTAQPGRIKDCGMRFFQPINLDEIAVETDAIAQLTGHHVQLEKPMTSAVVSTRIATAVISQPDGMKNGLMPVMPGNRRAMRITRHFSNPPYGFQTLSGDMRSLHYESPDQGVTIIL